MGCVFVAVALLTACCNKPAAVENDKQPPIVLSKHSSAIFDSGISFSSDAPQPVTLQFTASQKWSASITDTKSSSWLTVDPSSGEPGDVTMTVSAVANEGEEIRSAQVSLQCGSETLILRVTQAGKPVIQVTSIRLDRTTVDLTLGEDVTLIATVLPDDAADKTVSWSSSNPGVASVDPSGKVTALAGGQAVITAKSGNVKATCTVTVIVPVIPVESITLDREGIVLFNGQSIQLIAIVEPENATDKAVIWSSSNTAVASVSSSGLVTAITPGEATITVTAGDKSATCSVTVQKAVLILSSYYVEVPTSGGSFTLTVTASLQYSVTQFPAWVVQESQSGDVYGFSVPVNSNNTEREGYISFMDSNGTVASCMVRQVAAAADGSNEDINPGDPVNW